MSQIVIIFDFVETCRSRIASGLCALCVYLPSKLSIALVVFARRFPLRTDRRPTVGGSRAHLLALNVLALPSTYKFNASNIERACVLALNVLKCVRGFRCVLHTYLYKYYNNIIHNN